MTWRLCKALGATAREGLLGEINAAAPNRSRASDGGIGDPRHAARSSDHNPCKCCRVVCARDFTHDPAGGFDSYAFAEWLRGRVVAGAEPRVRYVISNGKIFSGAGQSHTAGRWRPYTGSNKHAHHVHVSVRHGPDSYDNARPWGWPPAPAAPGGHAMSKRPEDKIPPPPPPDDEDAVKDLEDPEPPPAEDDAEEYEPPEPRQK